MNFRPPARGIRSRGLVAALGTTAALLVAMLVAAPAAMASTAAAPGWYELEAPWSSLVCSDSQTLAVGSNGEAMWAKLCVTQTSAGSAQAYIMIHNNSLSTAVAKASVQVKLVYNSDVSNGPTYSCGGKYLVPYYSLFCMGYNTVNNGTARKGLLAYAEGTASVNGYGKWFTTISRPLKLG